MKRNIYAIVEEVYGFLMFCMSKILTQDNFKWVVTNKEKKDGYYSFKELGWEICFDFNIRYGWAVYLCNEFEEVIEERNCKCQEEAVAIANVLYQKFPVPVVTL